ncbi:MAG: nucleotide exchange factor GrpE [Candidatus Omnitrophica bacterium]|nr:nucleotide exchange factor GrpE [Candidatus Omnitrophota bacterium]
MGQNKPLDENSSQEVRSAVEIALERASHLEEEPIRIETEAGSVTMTFEELKARAAEASEFLTQLQYKQAEFENYRRRVLKEKEDLMSESIPISDLFDIVDHLDMAVSSSGDADSIRQGVQLIRNQLWALLEKKGVERVPSEGESFDPNHHEAIAAQPHDSFPEGTVVQEFRTGYRLGEKVLRPGKVVVSSGQR